jgi:hypothetical protein
MHCSRVDAFRHRAAATIADPAAAGHACRALTLTDGNADENPFDKSKRGSRFEFDAFSRREPLATSLENALERVARDEGHPPRIVSDVDMRAGGGESARDELGDHFGFAVAL